MENICIICNKHFTPHKQHPHQRVCNEENCKKEYKRNARHEYYLRDKAQNPDKYKRVLRSTLDAKDLERLRQKDRENYRKNIEQNRQRARKYYYTHREECNKRSLKYRHEHLEHLRERDRKRRLNYTGKNRIRAIAHAKLQKAKKTGVITKQPCEMCGSHNVEAHHDDYGRPLDVRWLCPFHHREWHKSNSPIYSIGETDG